MIKKTKKGFTLIELIIIIAILALLVAVAVPMMSNWIDEAGESERQSNRRTIELVVRAYMAEKDLKEFPGSNLEEAYVLHLKTLAEQYGSSSGFVDTGQGFFKLEKAGSGHYIIYKNGVVTVEKAGNKEDKGKIEYYPTGG